MDTSSGTAQRRIPTTNNSNKSQSENNDAQSKSTDQKDQVTCCERFLSFVSLWGLHFINVIDTLVGAMLLVISLILFANLGSNSENFQNSWLAYTCMFLGFLLLIIAGFSFLGVYCSCCRCSAVVSGYLATAAGLFCLVLFTIFLVLKPIIFEYFEKDGESLGLSSSDIKLTETWYMILDIGLFVVALLEGLRYLLSNKFFELSGKIDSEESKPLLGDRNHV